ncbi:MAG: MBL fold metallo-hydrolase [Myxococcota bacterium]
MPEWKLAIDVGRGHRDALRCDHLALTHTHMDHAAGLPYLLALRQLYRMAPPTVYVPAQMADAVRELIAAWDRIQRFESRYHLVAAEPGARYPLRRGLELVPFRTYHPVPSLGYSVIHTVDKLKAEYHGVPGPEIARLRKSGVEVTAPVERRLLSVTGDTLPEVLERSPHVADAATLLIECTFLDDRKDYDDCRAGGHVHLRDLLERADRLVCDHLVLSHFSQIYRWHEIPDLLAPLADRIPATVHAFPTRPERDAEGPISS